MYQAFLYLHEIRYYHYIQPTLKSQQKKEKIGIFRVRFTFVGRFFTLLRVFNPIIVAILCSAKQPARPTPMMNLNQSISYLTASNAYLPHSYTHLQPARAYIITFSPKYIVTQLLLIDRNVSVQIIKRLPFTSPMLLTLLVQIIKQLFRQAIPQPTCSLLWASVSCFCVLAK